jgi:transketolase
LLGESVPEAVNGFHLSVNGKYPFEDERLYDYRNYPAALYAKPGEKKANRNALAKWGAWVNTFGAKEYGRPLVLACSADLAGSTNVSGFGEGLDGFEGFGWYGRNGSKWALSCRKKSLSSRTLV